MKFFGWLDLQTLTGIGHLEFDETAAQVKYISVIFFCFKRDVTAPTSFYACSIGILNGFSHACAFF